MSGERRYTFRSAAHLGFWLVAALFLLEAVDQWLRAVHGATLDHLGIRPRQLTGLWGILFAPLLHGNWGHLLANSVPLLVLLTLLFWDRRYRPASTLALLWVVSGLGTWLIGRGGSVHIGASSLIFGLVAYLIVGGVLLGRWRTVGVAVLVAVVFGGIFYGVLPQAGPVSWEGHLCGATAGVMAARSPRK